MIDNIILEIVFFTIFITIVVTILRFIEHKFRVRIGPDRDIEQLQRQIDSFKSRIGELENLLREEKRERETEKASSQNKVSILEAQVSFLTSQLQKTIKDVGILEEQARLLKAKANELEIENTFLRKKSSAIELMPIFPLLHIWGNEEFGEQDQVQLNRANVPYRTLVAEGLRDVEDEFQRRREDGTEYWWVLVSAHGNRDGIYLGKELADPIWWNQVIVRGTKLIVLANCEGPDVGDALAGIADRVIVMYGDIPTEHASAFILSLFRSLMMGKSADESFQIARQRVPQISSHVDIRRS